MKLHSFSNYKEFQSLVFDFLCEHEAKNCLLLGILEGMESNPGRYPIAYFWAVTENDKVVGAAGMTPPFPLGMTAMPPEGLALLRDTINEISHQPTQVNGPNEIPLEFKNLWTNSERSQVKSPKMAQKIFQLTEVLPPRKTNGHMRVATENDLELLIDWNISFAQDCGLSYDPSSAKSSAKDDAIRAINRKTRYLWCIDGEPVAMTSADGKTPRGIRISWVYTPNKFRGRGYASAVVAELSQKMLDEGRDFCFLYTDLANPTSNSIYQKIGYKPVGDANVYDL
jgi:predicted GNAT family acetyltransferase